MPKATMSNPQRALALGRRQLLAAGGWSLGWGLLASIVPAHAASGELEAAVRGFSGNGPVREGKVRLDLAPLVENGNAVPVSVEVESPMSAADHVVAIAIFNERNPQREVAHFTLGPRAGRARLSTRIRLATSQKIVAVAKMNDGSCWSQTVDVVVTLAACIEG